MHMGDRVRALRLAAGLSQERLGKMLNMAQQHVLILERSGRIQASDLPALARVLQVPLTAFYAAEELRHVPQTGAGDLELLGAARGLTAAQREALVRLLVTLSGRAVPSGPQPGRNVEVGTCGAAPAARP